MLSDKEQQRKANFTLFSWFKCCILKSLYSCTVVLWIKQSLRFKNTHVIQFVEHKNLFSTISWRAVRIACICTLPHCQTLDQIFHSFFFLIKVDSIVNSSNSSLFIKMLIAYLENWSDYFKFYDQTSEAALEQQISQRGESEKSRLH